jgi:hypothetical protein
MYIDEMTVQEYFDLKKKGYIDREILLMYGYSAESQSVLTNWKRRNGVQLFRTKKRDTHVLDCLTLIDLCKMKMKGWTHEEVAEELSVNRSTLNKWIEEYKKNGKLPSRKLYQIDWSYIYHKEKEKEL